MEWPVAAQYGFDKAKSRIKVFTFKDKSLLARMAHDLELHAPNVTGTVKVEGEVATVDASVDLWSLTVAPGQLNRIEVAECENLMRKHVLKRRDLAVAKFKGTLEGGAAKPVLVGDLTLVGSRPRRIEIPLTIASVDESGFTARGGTKLLQTQYGIVPFTYMMGSLRLKDEIGIELEVRLSRT